MIDASTPQGAKRKRGRPVKRADGQAALSAIIKAENKEQLLSMCQALGISQADGLDLLISEYALRIETFGVRSAEPDDYISMLDRALAQYLTAIGLGSTPEYRARVLSDFVQGIAN